MYVNGTLDHTLVGSGFTIVYNPGVGGLVTITIIAVDSAGNESEPASITVDMDQP